MSPTEKIRPSTLEDVLWRMRAERDFARHDGDEDAARIWASAVGLVELVYFSNGGPA